MKIKNVGNNDVNSFTTGRTCSNNNPGVLVVIMILNRSVLIDLKEFFQSFFKLGPHGETHCFSDITPRICVLGKLGGRGEQCSLRETKLSHVDAVAGNARRRCFTRGLALAQARSPVFALAKTGWPLPDASPPLGELALYVQARSPVFALAKTGWPPPGASPTGVRGRPNRWTGQSSSTL